MEQTLQALTGIIQKAVVTVVLFIFLHWFLKIMLFGPLDKVLKERRGMTDGARKSAEKSLAAAEEKARQFEIQLQGARGQVYKEQEETRSKWLADQADQLAQARSTMGATVAKAKQVLAAEVTVAKQSLSAETSALAEKIVATVLSRRAS